VTTVASATGERPKAAEGLPRYDLVVLSPHLDDAALSCGGSIHRSVRGGGRVLVATLFAGDPLHVARSGFAREVESRWALGEQVMERRRAEDERAMAILGVEARHSPLVDALYRTGDDGEPLYPSLAELRAEERDPAALEEQLEESIRTLPSARRVLAPLAVGGHVDHRLTRRAAERVFGAAPEVRYYEDYPYSRSRFALRRALGRRRWWLPEVVELDPADVEARCAAILAYASQLGTAFEGERDLRRQVRREVSRRGGERLWRKS